MVHEEASKLFLMGVEHERNGRYDDAIKCYKNAIHLDSDIEYHMHGIVADKTVASNQVSKTQSGNNLREGSVLIMEENSKYDGTEPIEDYIKSVITSNAICVPDKPQEATHISVLPREMLITVFRWVVSDELDLRSLEKCSIVCRGFYVCARDVSIWKSACFRTLRNIDNDGKHLTDYRKMFISGLRVGTDGCYIGESSYYRLGENAFLDNSSSSSRPCYMVKYYRYIRFFVDGTVLFLSTTDPPKKAIHLLKYKTPNTNSVGYGTYQMEGELIRVSYTRTYSSADGTGDYRLSYYVEFLLKRCTSQKMNGTKLVWKTHITQSNDTNTLNDIRPDGQMPLIFSRVKSYDLDSSHPI